MEIGYGFSLADPAFNGVEIGRGKGNNVSNTAIGADALSSNTTGIYNTALGYVALNANTTGVNNTAVGYAVLDANTTGTNNTALGASALGANTAGTNNTALGYNALVVSDGSSNTAVGASTLYTNTTGGSNTAVGYSALASNTTAVNNTAVGTDALSSSTTGASNTAIGVNAGNTLTTGSNNTLLGNSAAPSVVTVSNEITLGNASIATLRCQVTTITALSDRRDKKDISDLPLGLDFINALRPVKFTWARRDGAKEGVQEAGFIAQELDELQLAWRAEDYLDLVLKSNPEKLEAAPGKLLPILVKAIQELSAKNAELEHRIAARETGNHKTLC